MDRLIFSMNQFAAQSDSVKIESKVGFKNLFL